MTRQPFEIRQRMGGAFALAPNIGKHALGLPHCVSGDRRHDRSPNEKQEMCAIGCILGALLSFAVALVFPNIPGIGDLISFKPRVAVIAPIMVAAFALCILGSLLPAWRAVRLVPADALRRLCDSRAGAARTEHSLQHAISSAPQGRDIVQRNGAGHGLSFEVRAEPARESSHPPTGV